MAARKKNQILAIKNALRNQGGKRTPCGNGGNKEVNKKVFDAVFVFFPDLRMPLHCSWDFLLNIVLRLGMLLSASKAVPESQANGTV